MPDFFVKILKWFNETPDINRMGFLTSFFKVTPDSFTDANKAEIDIVRSGKKIAPVVRNLSTGAVTIVEDAFGTKEVPFPVHNLEKPVNISELMNRQPNESAYIKERVNWFGLLARRLVSGFSKMTDMVKNSVELQAAQVLQTGKISLTDEDGNPTFELDLKVKATHLPTVTKSWEDEDSDPLGDISALADICRNDGKAEIKNLIMDETSLNNFLKNKQVQEYLRADALRLGALNPAITNKGAKYYGYINVGSSQLDIWVYSASYEVFETDESKKYLEENKVIFLSDFNDLDFRRLFGGIPTIRPDKTFDQLFGAAKVTIDGAYDFRPRVYFDEKAETYIGGIKSRPLCLPVSIDRFACLTTKATV